MGLTKEKQRTLRALYARWGVEAVRQDLDRNGWLLTPEVGDFARSWVAAEDRKRQRSAARVKFLCASAIGVLAGAVLARMLQHGMLSLS